MELLSGIGGEAYKDVRNGIVSTGKEIEYGKTLGEKWLSLRGAAEKLNARRDDVMATQERNKTKWVSKELKLWIATAEKHDEDVKNLKVKYEKEMDSGKRPLRFFKRSNLSKRLEAKYHELLRCWEDGSDYAKEVVAEKPQKSVTGKRKAPNIKGKSSLFESFEKTLLLLKNKDFKRIGIWGKVGVGKTAIMQNLKENEEIARMFDIVIFVTLTEEWDRDKLLLEIAKKLEITSSNEKVAPLITEKLESKRYLLLLDDVERDFDPDDIDICNNGKDNKVVLASRNRRICLRMDVDDVIEVKPLSEDDALKFFEEQLGRYKNSDLKPIARQIVRECGNLPLLIHRVATNFRAKEDYREWKDGFEDLRNWPSDEDKSMDDVLNLLRFCYDELRDERKQHCFLYGALYPEGCDIYEDYLVECWRAEGFIGVADRSIRGKGHTILKDLIHVSLLENSEKVNHVRMDKVFRKLALKISTERPDFECLVEAGKELREPPDVKGWKDAKRISLMDNKLNNLPERPNCKTLSTLLLQRNNALTQVPQMFFKSMRDLCVLDLHRTSISMLPSSVSYLKNLKALYLNSCGNLVALPNEIKALKYLEVLDIRGTRISSLPANIGCLDHLWCFRMSFSNVETQPRCFHMPFGKRDTKSRKLKVCRNVISKMSSLEELVIDVDPEIQWWCELLKAIIQGTENLEKLTHLIFSIDQYRLSRYKIVDYYDYDKCKCLKYANGEKIDPVMDVLAKADAFELIGHKGVVALSDFNPNINSNVKTCVIEGCIEMETVFDGNKIKNVVFQSLEKMYIYDIPKLQSIWKGPAPASTETLNRLTTLVLFKCSMLKNIFCCSLIQQLSSLSHLEVESCHEVIEIITRSGNHDLDRHPFQSLNVLILVDLPKLVSIWMDDTLKWPSLKKSFVHECPQLEKFPEVNT